MDRKGLVTTRAREGARSPIKSVLVATASGAVLMFAASGAVAQAPQSDSVQEVVVTASRITAAGFDAPTPTTVLGADLIEKAAQPNLFTAITQLPSLQGNTGTTVANGNTSTGATGLSGLNLRGLGTFRTLTLLDGQRVVPSNVSGITDVSQFPQLLVQRVEVVTGGASASYGSDAVAGVVNFITDKRFSGFKANVQGGVTTYGDGKRYTGQVAYGRSFLNDRLHFAASGEYYHADAIRGALIGGIPLNGRRAPQTSGNTSTSIAATPAGLPQFMYYQEGVQNITRGRNALITAGPLQGTAFGPDGTPYTFRYGGSGVPNRTAAGGVAGCVGNSCVGGDYQGITSSAGGGSDIEAMINRGVAYGRLSYEISDNLEVFATYNYADVFTVTSPTRGTPKPNLTAQCDNAFLHPSIATMCANARITSFTFGTLATNLNHYLRVENARKMRRAVLGAEGSFNLLGKEWRFDSYFQHGESIANVRVRNNVLTTPFNDAIDAIRLPTGQIVCRNVAARAAGCLPYNVFADVLNSEESYRYFAPASGSTSHTFQRQDAASIAFNGVPFQNWAGDVALAFGAEWREEAYKTVGDPYGAGFDASPTSATFPFNPRLATTGGNWYAGNFYNGRGRFDVHEFFGEVGMPIWDQANVGKLDINAALRATNYSTSGWVTTWKLGGAWETPLDGLRFRAVQSRDIRAPNLSDLYAAPIVMNNFVQDRRRNNAQVQILNSQVGNPSLKPEISKNLELGTVYRPTWLPGLSLSFDYFDINMKQAIQVLTNQQIVDLCFNGNTELCPSVYLDGVIGTNNPSFVLVRPFNLASLKTNGFDIEASYRFNLETVGIPGQFTARGLATHTIDFITDPGVPGQPILQLAGNNSLQQPAPGNSGVASWKWFLQQTWETGPFQFTATERIVSKGEINPNYIVCTSSCPLPTAQNPTSNYNSIPGATYVDLGINYRVRDAITFFAKVDNVFNTLEPNFGSPGLYDTVGRRYQAGLRLSY